MDMKLLRATYAIVVHWTSILYEHAEASSVATTKRCTTDFEPGIYTPGLSTLMPMV